MSFFFAVAILTILAKIEQRKKNAAFQEVRVVQLFFYWLYICLVVVVNRDPFLWITLKFA